MFALWRRVGGTRARLPVAVQYEPPESLTPAEAGTLMDESADMRDITATMVDLAVRGHLRIEERDEKRAARPDVKRREYRLPPARLRRGSARHCSRTSAACSSGIFGGAETR